MITIQDTDGVSRVEAEGVCSSRTVHRTGIGKAIPTTSDGIKCDDIAVVIRKTKHTYVEVAVNILARYLEEHYLETGLYEPYCLPKLATFQTYFLCHLSLTVPSSSTAFCTSPMFSLTHYA